MGRRHPPRALAAGALALFGLLALSAHASEPSLPDYPLRPTGSTDPSSGSLAFQVWRLGSSDPSESRDAAARLFWLGEASRPVLESALDHGTATQAERAQRVLAWLDRAAGLASARFDRQLSTYFHRTQAVPDDLAPFGFCAKEPMWPSPYRWYRQQTCGPTPDLELIAEPEVLVPFKGRHRGLRVRLINYGAELQGFESQDGMLFVHAEARDASGEWHAIEFREPSFCGNSYYPVWLLPGHAWEFAAPRYEGPLRSRLRFVLPLPGSAPVYSNEIEVGLHPKQFERAPNRRRRSLEAVLKQNSTEPPPSRRRR